MKEVETPPAEKASRTQTAALLCSALLLARAVAEFCTVRRGRRRILPAHPLRPLSCPIVLVAAAGFIGGADGLSSAPPPRRAAREQDESEVGSSCSSSKHIQGLCSTALLFVDSSFLFLVTSSSPTGWKAQKPACVRACGRHLYAFLDASPRNRESSCSCTPKRLPVSSSITTCWRLLL